MINPELIKCCETGIIIKIKIIANSKNNKFFIDNGIIKVKITAQPIENKANLALISFLSKKFKIPKSKIKIIKGEHSKDKTILINTLKKEVFFENLE